MFKKIFAALFIIYLCFVGSTSIYAQEGDSNITSLRTLSSNNYTRVENVSGTTVNNANIVIGPNYQKMAETTQLALYVDKNNFSIKIQNKSTQYVWTSNLEKTDGERLNTQWANFAKSSIIVYYYDKDFNKKQMTLYDNNVTMKIEKIDNGVKNSISFGDIGVSFDVKITLYDDYFEAEVPSSSITDKNGLLVSIELFPFFGAVKDGQINGYTFIPDGSGALVRFTSDKIADEAYIQRVYGIDEAFIERLGTGQSSTSGIGSDDLISNIRPKRVSMPVYGMVHGVKKNGYVTMIQSGAEYANIVFYPAGVSTDFNWITTEFVYRERYFQPISKSMDGFLTYQSERNDFDARLKIVILSNDDADYVGMAKRYQRELLDKGVLRENILDKEGIDIPMRVEFFGGETKKVLFWNTVVPMTTANEAASILADLRRSGIKNLMIIYKGITKDGFSGTFPQIFPFEESLGSQAAFMDFFKTNNTNNSKAALYVDLTTAYDRAKGFNHRYDISYKINKRPIQFSTSYVGDYFYLTSSASLRIFNENLKNFVDYNISSIAVDVTPSLLTSTFLSGAKITRAESIKNYESLFKRMNENFKSVSLYQPNEYLLQYANNYLDVPLYSSQYIFETDTVPFLEIVLRGYVDMYSPLLNYSPDIEEESLRMIEYGVYPSFLLTAQAPYLLIDTPSKNIISSKYDDLKESMIELYKKVNNALKYVKNQRIVSREVLSDKIVKVGYSNGVSIIVNYTDSPFPYKGKVVNARDYLVMMAGDAR